LRAPEGAACAADAGAGGPEQLPAAHQVQDGQALLLQQRLVRARQAALLVRVRVQERLRGAQVRGVTTRAPLGAAPRQPFLHCTPGAQ